jgi:hypothetical protein
MRNGILTSMRKKEISISKSSLSKIAIPVAPPSRNPFGSKNILRPILARKIPIAI